MTRPHKRRRGIVILVVLSLLVLFVLLAVTFALVAGMHRRTMEAYSRQDLLGVSPQKDLDRAMYQILRDTTIRASAARYQSLLRDYYGGDGFSGSFSNVKIPTSPVTPPDSLQKIVNQVIPAASPPYPPPTTGAQRMSGGQFIDLVVDVDRDEDGNGFFSNDRMIVSTDGIDLTAKHSSASNPYASSDGAYFYGLSRTPGYYNGCLLTITTGAARGVSTRIVGYDYIAYGGVNFPYFRVLAPKTDSGQLVAPADLAGKEFVVNGRPFNGTGFGFDDSGSDDLLGDATDATTGLASGQPVALLPNSSSLSAVPTSVNRTLPAPFQPLGPPVNLPSVLEPLLLGGADEAYDAVDYQNMFLAMNMPSEWLPGPDREWGVAGVDDDSDGNTDEADGEAGFSGSDDVRATIPSFHRPMLINYWINSGPSTIYKTNPPLYTWDNIRDDFKRRISLRPVEWNFDSYDPVNGPWDVDNDGDGIPDSIWIDLGLPVQTAPDGRQYKPLFAILCVDLDGRMNVNAHGRVARFSPAVPRPTVAGGGDTSNLRMGLGYGPPEIELSGTGISSDFTRLFAARYGTDGVPGASGYDELAKTKFFEEPENYFTGTGLPGGTPRSSYSSPADLRAELAFGVNAFGQPTFDTLNATDDSNEDSAYELNLVEPGVSDSRFTEAELEAVLRRFDVDVNSLPKRLAGHIANLQTSTNARLVTTASFDPPVQGVVATGQMAGLVSTANSFRDLLKARLVEGGATNVGQELKEMLSPDLATGIRMDLNRPMGNGRDRTAAANVVVDEPGEELGEEIYTDMSRTEFQSVSLYHSNGIDVNDDSNLNLIDQQLARQLFARHLYVLMMTLVERPPTIADQETLAKQVAQWAINVVDFRDADSIMTPFEYDQQPFNADGWGVDGNVTTTAGETDREVVWGCERPELLLTESFAFHVRRTTDSPDDTSGTANHDLAGGDPHYDQEHLPFASAFVEMYNPWSGTDTNTTPPRELYGSMGGVRLNQVTPSSNNPVWRLMIVSRADDGAIVNNNHDPDDGSPTNPRDRVVYFVDDLANAPPRSNADGLRRYYTDQGVAPIAPGQYAVVGGGMLSGGEWISPVGDIDTVTNPGVTDGRRVVLVPNASQVRVHQGNGQAPETARAVAIVANLTDVDVTTRIQTAFSVSEPRTGYPIVSGTAQFNATNFPNPPNPPANPPVPYDYSAVYEDSVAIGSPLPIDRPLDDSEAPTVSFRTMVARTAGTTRTFCRVYLQRLANPLQDWSPTNPYRTIDSIPMDLTAFNGLETAPVTAGNVSSTGLDFSCLQRGDSDPATERRRLWLQEPTRAAVAATFPAVADDAIHFFGFNLDAASLGLLNDEYGGAVSAANPTFPWLVWNNRPFVSPYELLHVPSHNNWELLKNFTLPTTIGTPYRTDAIQAQYGYLLNFFHADGEGANPPDPNVSSKHFYRIFDYVHVPSRFVGTETVLNPNYFGKTTNYPQPNGISRGLLPPFNRVSMFRDPGRVNINTIFSDTVWDAIRGGIGPDYDDLSDSRKSPPPQEDPSIGSRGNALATNYDQIPTYFANPVRPAGAGKLVPLHNIGTEQDYDHDYVDASGTNQTGKYERDIDTTLLRGTDSLTNPDPFLQEDSISNHAISARNSFFRYRLLHNLGNMVTTRSNVYAMWITVGYFEVEPNVDGNPSSSNYTKVIYDEFHPDGVRVAQEMGIDSGELKRHRAFYIIDRTIPVAFQPGQNHNVDKCILQRRFIE